MRTQAEIRDKFAPSEELAGHKVFFLVGIGGAGMSGLAKMLHSRGFEVKGSDSTPSAVTAGLQVLGINVHVGHTGSGIKANMAVILTDAIDLENSAEVACARNLGCKIFRRSQLLGWLVTEYRVIAVTGTHGKTTTR